MKRLNAYLRFNGNCRAAMQFYRDCLGGELRVMTVGESAMASQMPPEMKDKVMHSALESDGMVLMASDLMGPEEIVKGNTFTLCINGNNKKEIETYFLKLSAGGNVTQPFEEMFFGIFGALTDKFGTDWIFEADKP